MVSKARYKKDQRKEKMIYFCICPNWKIYKFLKIFLTRKQDFRFDCRYCGWAAADILTPSIDEIAKQIINNSLDTYIDGFGKVDLPHRLQHTLEQITTKFTKANETSRVNHNFTRELNALQQALNLCAKTASKIRKHIWRTIYKQTYTANLQKEDEYTERGEISYLIYDRAKIRN